MNNRTARLFNRAKHLGFESAIIAALGGPFLTGIWPAPANAQSQATQKPLAFDAVSIRPFNAIGSRSEPGLLFLPGRVVSTPAGVTAKQLVAEAYQLTEYQVDGPAWLGSDLFALQATMAASVDRNAIRLMLQTLLADRFNLAASRGTKEMPVYALMVAGGGSGPARYQVKTQADSPTVAADSSRFQKADAALEGHTGGRGSAFTNTTMEAFARSLSELRSGPNASLLGRPVIDRTGLGGRFTFNLAWNNDDDLFSALRDILGLRVESQRANMEIVVIDRIDKPSAN